MRDERINLRRIAGIAATAAAGATLAIGLASCGGSSSADTGSVAKLTVPGGDTAGALSAPASTTSTTTSAAASSNDSAGGSTPSDSTGGNADGGGDNSGGGGTDSGSGGNADSGGAAIQ